MVATKKRVLVVDDEEIVRESYQRALTDAGYTVRTVGNGRDALRACRAERFDLMLADLRMAEMDGIEVTRAVTREFPEVRVVIITGYPSRSSCEQAVQLGVFDYLEKPLSPERLSAATAAALADPPNRMVAPGVEAAVPGPAQPIPDCGVTTPDSDAAGPDPGPPAKLATVVLEEVAEADIGTLRGLALLALAPFIGLAYVVFLPLIGFGMLFAVLGISLAERLGWVHK